MMCGIEFIGNYYLTEKKSGLFYCREWPLLISGNWVHCSYNHVILMIKRDILGVRGTNANLIDFKLTKVDSGSKQQALYSKTCLKRPLKNRQNKEHNDKWQHSEGRKFCRKLQESILQYF